MTDSIDDSKLNFLPKEDPGIKFILIGHRGVGKTSLANRMKSYFPDIPVIDLDEEISKSERKSISEIFQKVNEYGFREIEQRLLFANIQSHKQFILSVGAGCDLSVVRDQYRNVKIIWVRRETDLQGRIFLDRPRLNSNVPAIDEYLERAHQREEKYWRWSHEVYTLPEGLGRFPISKRQSVIEQNILNSTCQAIKGGMTVLPETFRDEASKKFFAQRFLKQQPDFFELRDDLLNPDQIQDFLSFFRRDNVIFSLRAQREIPLWVQESQCWIDWALENGAAPEYVLAFHSRLILSMHDSNSVVAGIEKLSALEEQKIAKHYKYSPFVKSWAELQMGLEWQRQSPATRSFLPRSINGRWQWIRLYLKGRQLINFWREGFGSAMDQPSLWQWLNAKEDKKGFAAVLGSPIRHSYSPLFHSDFFDSFDMDFYAVQIEKSEFTSALAILEKLGLKAAAVTSPLKDQVGKHRNGINTLVIPDQFFSTDAEGLEVLAQQMPVDSEVIVWGGGGTLPALEKVFPNAIYVSSRTGLVRESNQAIPPKQKSKRVLIWAAPNSTDTKMPGAELMFDMIFDLNYSDDSMGLSVAQILKLPYTSGLAMFIGQAEAQQKIFRSELGK